MHTNALNFHVHFGETEARVVESIMKQQEVYKKHVWRFVYVCVCVSEWLEGVTEDLLSTVCAMYSN